MNSASIPSAPQAQSPAAAKLKVFISYSREDLKFADQLDIGLKLCGFEPMLDRHGISGGEDWRQRLGSLIREADTVVFVLSPASAKSEICKWEVDESARLNKRILPVLCRSLEDATPPALLQERNYIYFYDEAQAPGSGFASGLSQLVTALHTDLVWIREHTRLLARATEWDAGGRPANRLLSGSDIADAKEWLARRPKDAPAPTDLHLDFIKASEQAEAARSNAQRQQLEAMARAQDERAKALSAAEEALARAADAQAKRARIRNAALVVVTLFAGIAVFTAWQWNRADVQRVAALEERAQQAARAEEEKSRAYEMLAASNNVIALLSKKYSFDASDYANVRSIFEKGAEQQSEISMVNLGRTYLQGPPAERNYAKAREWFEKAAAAGSPDAMNDLGLLYEQGQGITQDYAKARDWYEKAAAKDSAAAMADLGGLYANGNGVAIDYAAARDWYAKAVAADDAHGMAGLAWLYTGGHGVAQDYAKARELYERAAAKGYAGAIGNLGILYANGQGVTQDYAKARELFEQAAGKGDTPAKVGLGLLYAGGKGVPRDFDQARGWFEKAAAEGSTEAMNNIGVLYAQGHGVPQDYAKAREWHEKAAAAGDVLAMNMLGLFYAGGVGVSQDFVKARAWFEKAAAKDSPMGMKGLGDLYAHGQGVAQDYAEARDWYGKAAAKGDASAKTELRNLAVTEAEAAGRYDEALKLRVAIAEEVESEERKLVGSPGKQTADKLLNVAWSALLAHDFTLSLSASERALKLTPDDLDIESNRAHALMFLGRLDEARALYLGNKGKPTMIDNGKLWDAVVVEDFAALRKAQLTHPLMDEIEAQLNAGK